MRKRSTSSKFISSKLVGASSVEPSIRGPVLDPFSLGHENGPLDGMIEFSNVTGPGKLDERLECFVFESTDLLSVMLGMLSQED